MGKSTTAIHLAGFFQTQGETLLIDLDPNPTSLSWAEKGKLPFQVISDEETFRKKRFATLVYDTSARPKKRSLKDIVQDADLVVVPTTVSSLALEGTLSTLHMLHEEGVRPVVVFVNVPPRSEREVQQARDVLLQQQVTVAPVVVRRSNAYEKAATEGCLVRDLKSVRQRLYWSDFEQLGRYLQNQL